MSLPEFQPTHDETVDEADLFLLSIDRRLEYLGALKPGWDGEDSIAIKPEIMAAARRVVLAMREREPALEEPFLSPSYDGLIQLEWHRPDRSLDLELSSPEWRAEACERPEGGEWEFHGASLQPFDYDAIMDAYRWYLDKSRAW